MSPLEKELDTWTRAAKTKHPHCEAAIDRLAKHLLEEVADDRLSVSMHELQEVFYDRLRFYCPPPPTRKRKSLGKRAI